MSTKQQTGYVHFSWGGIEWILLSLAPNRDGVYKCQMVESGAVGWFVAQNLRKAGLYV